MRSAAAELAAGGDDGAVLDADGAALHRADSSETSFRAKTASNDGRMWSFKNSQMKHMSCTQSPARALDGLACPHTRGGLHLT